MDKVEGDDQPATKTITKKKNTNETCLVLLKIPQREQEEEVKIEVGQAIEGKEEDEEQIEKITKMVDTDQKDRAMAITCRDIPGYPNGNTFVIN